jgi:fructose-1,6-bisphosphatase/inositol monophosphatase family enzyme
MLGCAAIDRAWLAQGHLHASITLSKKPSDMSPGVILESETGPAVTDADGVGSSLASKARIAPHPEFLPALMAEATPFAHSLTPEG